jgi:hypothetical protein
MFGLIKQLAKLITIAKNIPALLLLLPKLLKENNETGTLEISVDIAKVVSLPQIAKYVGDIQDRAQDSIGSENQFHEYLLEQIENNEDLSTSEKTLETANEVSRHTDRLQKISSDTLSSIEEVTEDVAQQRAVQIDPAIRTALAPLTMAVGIPQGIQWLTSIVSGLGNVPVVGAAAAEAAFNSDINSAEAAEGTDGGYPVGSTIVDKEVLLTFSQVEDPAFEYDDNGVAIPRLNLFVKDEDVKDNPNYNLTLKSYGVNFPSNQKDRVTYFINENGEITINWRYASIDTNISNPRFDSSITFSVGADKINRRRFRPDGTTRARNTFVIPIRFASTYPEQ